MIAQSAALQPFGALPEARRAFGYSEPQSGAGVVRDPPLPTPDHIVRVMHRQRVGVPDAQEFAGRPSR